MKGCRLIPGYPTGYFSLNHTRMGPAQDLFGQLWKEYALSDSRYLTSDPFVLCMETVTAVRILTTQFVLLHRLTSMRQLVHLGPIVLCCCCIHHHSTSSPPPS